SLHEAEENNFHATLYCANASGTLILAFRGAASVTQLRSNRDDAVNEWVYTNFVQHFGNRPVQYQLANESAHNVLEDLDHGALDGTCGSNRPHIMLAGHSKGGGQAQYAAINTSLEAVVFNSDMINPVLSTDWLYHNAIPSWVTRNARTSAYLLN